MKYNDRFLYFTYNGVHSSEFGLFYTNTGDNFSIPFVSPRKNNTTNPMYQDYIYWTGSNRESKQFQLELASDGKTLPEIREITNWLSPGRPGKLSFDYDPYYEYEVVVDSLTPVNILLKELKSNLMDNVILFNIIFNTIGDGRAISKHPEVLGNSIHYLKDSYLPYFFNDFGGKKLIVNWENSPQYLNIEFSITNSSKNFAVFFDTVKTYEYTGLPNQAYRLDTRTGAATVNVGGVEMLAERHGPAATVINNGPYGVKPSLILKTEAIFNGSSFTLSKSLGPNPLTGLVVVATPLKDKKRQMVQIAEGDYHYGEVQGSSLVVEKPYIAVGSGSSITVSTSKVFGQDSAYSPIVGEKVNLWLAQGTSINISGAADIVMTYRRGD